MTEQDTIEFEEPRYSTCDCCGNRSTHLVRYVNRGEDAYAVYVVDFAEGHDSVAVLASFGGWGDDSYTPADRTAFAFMIWATPDDFNTGLLDASQSGYSTDYFGRILDREEALDHPLCQEVFDLSDHIVRCDEPVIEFLSGTRE